MAAPNAWDDGWEEDADNDRSDDRPQSPSGPPKRSSAQAQRRLKQQAFNNEIWKDGTPNYLTPNDFLQTQILPNADLKPRPILLSKKPAVLASDETSGEEEGQGEKKPTGKDEGVKTLDQRRLEYEARRLELFGPTSTASTTTTTARGADRKARYPSRPNFLSLKPSSLSPKTNERELFDPDYTPKPERPITGPDSRQQVIEPIRSPRGPDGSSRGGFGFAPRGRGSGLPPHREQT